MVQRQCLDCGRLSPRTRCPTCTQTVEAARPLRPTGQTRDWAERQRRAAAVTAHREALGEWCPGWQTRPAHHVVPPNILTADHEVAVGAGGDPRGPLVVRCRACNSAKADRH